MRKSDARSKNHQSTEKQPVITVIGISMEMCVTKVKNKNSSVKTYNLRESLPEWMTLTPAQQKRIGIFVGLESQISYETVILVSMFRYEVKEVKMVKRITILDYYL